MKKYPIAEIFTSPQGEGLYTGTLMTFIRFAGCSVGKKMNKQKRAEMLQKVFPLKVNAEHDHFRELPNGELVPEESAFRIIPEYTEVCTTYDGREFLCDTDFRTKEVLTVEEIVSKIPEGVEHVCLTGGEPLIHDLLPLITALKKFFDDRLGVKYHMPCIHIETSGTVDVTDSDEFSFDEGYIWLTVSPKLGVLNVMLELADEIKILVDEGFDESKIPEEMKLESWRFSVWLQPVNFEFDVNRANMRRVLELQKKHPSWRISSQAHKIWNVR